MFNHSLHDHAIGNVITVEEQVVLKFFAHAEETQFAQVDALLRALFCAH